MVYIFMWQSCKTPPLSVKSPTKDPEMEMGNDAGKVFQNYVHSIREGGNPAGTTKASGGCGCN